MSVPVLPAGPFRDWLKRKIREYGDAEAASRRLNVSSALIRDIVKDDAPRDIVSVDAVDRAFTASGDPGLLYRMYPLEAPQEAAA